MISSSPLRAETSRIHAATALRALAHSFVSHRAPHGLLERIATSAEGFTAALLTHEPRRRSIDAMKHDLFGAEIADGESVDHFPDCVVSGLANPMGIAIRVHRDGDESVARVTLGPAFEGAPGRAHGGIVAAIFDDAMGFVLTMEQQPAFTGRLMVTYRAPTPIGEELEFRARLAERKDRKLIIRGTATARSTVVAEAEGLFIAISPERFSEAVRPRATDATP
jgi:acyl-coenzyme A thioesterase PaaI-like protein